METIFESTFTALTGSYPGKVYASFTLGLDAIELK